ncbi:glycosyltransferase family 2 protein [soil metagenome]
MKYSVVVPIYGDGALARDFCVQLEKAFQGHLKKKRIEDDLELIFVDDGSRNDSARIVKETCEEFPFAKLIVLSRNFGQHVAVSCGYRFARGQYVGMLNVDQEDPPDQLLVLLETLETGDFDIVGGLYAKRTVPWFSKVTSYGFNMVLNRLTGYDGPLNASTVRVMNRKFIDAYNSLTERSRYFPGLEMWLGFRYGHVPVTHQPRKVGKSSYNFRRRLRMALDSVISFSDFPLKMTVKFGFVVVSLGILLLLALVVDKLFFRQFLPGYLSTITAVVLLGGIQVMVTGVASLYIGRILAEVQGRPLFVVRETFGDLEAPAESARPPRR